MSAPRPHARPGALRRWSSEVGLGAKLAIGGGREGLVRTVLTALGVGLGVAVLLLSVSIPGILDGRHVRTDARDDLHYGSEEPARSDTSVLMLPIQSSYHDRAVTGRFIQPDGAHPILPPGVPALPPVGSIVVSPALRDLLASPDGALLRARFPQPISGTIGKEGLSGPNELYFYGSRADLAQDQPQVLRLTHYGSESSNDPLNPVLLLLVVVIFVVLLMPVAMFVAAATRFGGEQRDRRLAAVRLVGADTWMTRRIAAGEAVVSAALGVLIGLGFFFAARSVAERFELAGLSVYASDVRPTPLLAGAIVVAVPLAALLMTLLALRRVVVEPLGVVRKAVARAKRRLWWRLLPLLGGAALLVPLLGGHRTERFNVWQAAFGIILLLLGLATLLPWLFDRLVTRLSSGGPVAWQIAIRRLQLSHDSALRAVNAVAVAVAGTIALQMLFAAAQAQSTAPTDQDVTQVQAVMRTELGGLTTVHSQAEVEAALRGTPGVKTAHSYYQHFGGPIGAGDRDFLEMVVADCDTLRLMASLPSCADGDVFAVDPASIPPEQQPQGLLDATALGGKELEFGKDAKDGAEPIRWSAPARLTTVRQHRDPFGSEHTGLLVTPSAAPPIGADAHFYTFIGIDRATPDVAERVRNTAMSIGPANDVFMLSAVGVDKTFASIRRGLFAGATVVLVLVGLSLLVSTVEQLRERRRTFAALVAFGTRRATMAWSILWQTAVPVALGLVTASIMGLILGSALLRIVVVEVRPDWAGIGVVGAIAAAVVLLVTAASLPPLFRLMRPEGLRFE
ncbi:ABC transporter permease [Dactylosporangium vinaceum]|uniref:ABC transporter permease n=1 Tax=Dactylosporangium vinaceum TaxID=53362 RepID=A0ABV5M3V3_9ACTN|nr:FtsX-like permease family protein [Dactylosporangium vinaceum]UAB93548.1 ABC transporter permease [Dactylosporangium vinaceum]